MTHGTGRLGLVVAATIVAWADVAHAYVRARSTVDDYDLIWPDPHISLTVYTGTSVVSPSDFVGAATAAAATWSAPAADTSVAIAIASSPAQPAGPVFDHENTISFRTSSWEAPMYPASALALTTIWTSGGKIVETDTEINAYDPSFHWAVLADDPAVAMTSGDDDLQNALTHELGHVLGLAHPCYLGVVPDPPALDNLGQPELGCSDPALPIDVRAATMYPTAAPGNIGERSLSSDEVMALRDLYPAGRAPVVEGPPAAPAAAGGCSVADAGRRDSFPLSAASLLLMAASIVVTRRRR
ncbi:MAG TPA: hypothetical protein VK989_03205 [Polyangia bacterium]|jgi:hypothetical protein|nr:hypothetical protein [Polyangia bacterium]